MADGLGSCSRGHQAFEFRALYCCSAGLKCHGEKKPTRTKKNDGRPSGLPSHRRCAWPFKGLDLVECVGGWVGGCVVLVVCLFLARSSEKRELFGVALCACGWPCAVQGGVMA